MRSFSLAVVALGFAPAALAFLGAQGPACTGTGVCPSFMDGTTAVTTASCAPDGFCGDDGAKCTTDDDCFDYCGSDGICGGTGAACSASGDITCFYGACPTATDPAQCPGPGASPAARLRQKRAPKACEKQGWTTCGVATGGRRRNIAFSWECVDTQTSIEQCGGCDAATGGVDCTALPGVSGVGCVAGQCVVESCESGFSLTDGKCF